MLQFVKKYWGIVLIFLIWFLFSYPYFIQHKVPYPSAYQVNFFPPWSQDQKNWGPVKNNAMPDVIAQIYPWKHFTIESLKNGQIPFWNPNNFGGNPHVGNFQSAVFTPFNLIFFVLPFIDAWSIVVLLQPLLAGLFTYWYAGSLRITKTGSVISAICFMFCGFIVVWMAYGTLSMTVAFLPLLLFAIERFIQIKKYRYIFLLSVVVPIIFFSGHFQTGLYVFIFSLLYAFARIISTKHTSFFFPIGIGLLIGLIISSIQLIPTVILYLESVRSEIFNVSGGIPFQYLITAIAPDFYGNPVTRNDWVGSYAEWASFIGIVPFLLGAYAIFFKRSFYSIFFTISAVVVLLLAVDTPLQGIIGSLKIPVISTSNPTRIIVLFSFSMAMLSGMGIDRMKDLFKNASRKKIIIPIVLVAVILLIVWLMLLGVRPMDTEKLMIAKRNLILPTLLFAGISAFCIAAMYVKRSYFTSLLFFVITLSVVFESLYFAQKWMPFDPEEKVFISLPVVSAMQKEVGNGRVFGNLGIQVETYYNLPSLEGYDPLYVSRFGEFIRSSSTGSFESAERSVVKLNRNGLYTKRVLDLLGVTVLFHPKADTNQSWAFPVWKDDKAFVKFYEDDLFELYKNNTAFSRAQLFYSYEIIKNKTDIINRFFSKDFNYKTTLILEKNPHIPSSLDAKGEVRIIVNSPNKIVIKAKSNAPGLLFLSDTYFPSWKATVNGKGTQIYRADYAFRAVAIPKGDSEVVFYYDPFAI